MVVILLSDVTYTNIDGQKITAPKGELVYVDEPRMIICRSNGDHLYIEREQYAVAC